MIPTDPYRFLDPDATPTRAIGWLDDSSALRPWRPVVERLHGPRAERRDVQAKDTEIVHLRHAVRVKGLVEPS